MTVQAESAVADDEQQEEFEQAEQGEQTEQEGESQTETEQSEQGGQEDPGEVVVSIGEESPPSDEDENRAPEWVRELRKSDREKSRRIRELEQRLESTQKPSATVVGQKPTLEGCDYDAEKFEAALESWHERKRKADDEEAVKKREEEKAAASWQATLDAYGKEKAELKVSDFEDAEEAARELFNQTQQGLLLKCPKDRATLIYALGKNPKKAKELAAITDPVDFVYAVADIRSQLKVTPRKAAPPPERRISGSAPVSGTADATLARLEAEADRTGDRSKVIAYRRQLRQKAA